MNDIEFYKKGNKIYIKKKNRGKFTDYCGGKVTNECIQRGKNSPDPKIRKRATFAANARTWKHQQGGIVKIEKKQLGGAFKLLKLIPKKFKPVLDSNLINNPYLKKLQLQRILEKINNGRGMVQEFLKSPHFGERASKHMTRQEAYKLGKFESQLLDTHNPPNGFNPLDIQLEIMPNGIAGNSSISHNSKNAKRILNIDPNNAVEPMYVGAHEAAHMSTLNYTPTNGWKVTRDLFPEEIKPLLDKQMENARVLANQLEIDPKKYVKAIQTVSQNRGVSTQQAKDIIDNWIPYLKRDQEARARGLAAVVYSKANHTKNIPKEVDGGQSIFTDSSLDNLYKNIFSIGVPIGLGLYATQN